MGPFEIPVQNVNCSFWESKGNLLSHCTHYVGHDMRLDSSEKRLRENLPENTIVCNAVRRMDQTKIQIRLPHQGQQIQHLWKLAIIFYSNKTFAVSLVKDLISFQGTDMHMGKHAS